MLQGHHKPNVINKNNLRHTLNYYSAFLLGLKMRIKIFILQTVTKDLRDIQNTNSIFYKERNEQ